MMKKIVYALLGASILAQSLFAAQTPYMKRNENGVLQLFVDGKPYVMLAGETMNSSSSTAENMEPSWAKLKALNLNTVLLSVSWESVEQEEGKYDFSVIKGLIDGAKKHDLKLVILWFGSWKNAASGYAPPWVLRDTKRFPRTKIAEGDGRRTLVNYSEELLKAESKTFRAMMEYIKKVDDDKTILMIQIENELGILADSRDRSEGANKLFEQNVPAELLKYFAENESKLLPEIREQWNARGKKMSGKWADVFGNKSNNLADELFMAWHFAKYVNTIAEEGKKAYPLPMFVNAWSINPETPETGTYPVGGPNSRGFDVWQFAAPAVDVLAVDNYRKDFRGKCAEFYRNGNPLFVPEAVPLWKGDTSSGPAGAFFTIAEFNAMCFSPFAIDHENYGTDHALGKAYAALKNLMPLIIKEHGSGNMHGFMQQEVIDFKAESKGKKKSDKKEMEKSHSIDFGDVVMHADYGYKYQAFGLVIRLSKDEFLVAGSGFDVTFTSKSKELPAISYGLIRDGYFEKNGEWKTMRYIGGDEAKQGIGGVKIPPLYLRKDAKPEIVSIVRIQVLPIEGEATVIKKDVFD